MKHMDLRQVPTQMKKKIDGTHDDIDVVTSSNNLVRKLHVLTTEYGFVVCFSWWGRPSEVARKLNKSCLVNGFVGIKMKQVLKVLGCQGWILNALLLTKWMVWYWQYLLIKKWTPLESCPFKTRKKLPISYCIHVSLYLFYHTIIMWW